MEKHHIDRRITQMQSEGVLFRTNIDVGLDVSLDRMLDDYEVVVLAGGAERPRDLPVPGRELAGIHGAMDYLTEQNRRVAGDAGAIASPPGTLDASGKHVVVIGGGDTGSDCIGTAHRQGAASVTSWKSCLSPRFTRTSR